MKERHYQFNFRGGLQTTRSEDGLPLPAHIRFQNVRLRTDAAKRRPGYVRLDASASNTAISFASASSEHGLVYEVAPHTLKKYWTLEILCKPTGVTGTQVLLSTAHATSVPVRLYLNADVVTAEVKDTADTTVTLTSSAVTATTMAIQLVRDGTDLTLRVDNVSEDTDTMADLDCKAPGGSLYIARDNTGNYFDGTIDYVRLFAIARTHHRDGLKRLADPRAEYVLADYVMEESETGYVRDRSRYGATLELQNTPTTSATALCHPYAPVNLIYPFKNRSNEKRVLVAAGSSLYSEAIP